MPRKDKVQLQIRYRKIRKESQLPLVSIPYFGYMYHIFGTESVLTATNRFFTSNFIGGYFLILSHPSVLPYTAAPMNYSGKQFIMRDMEKNFLKVCA